MSSDDDTLLLPEWYRSKDGMPYVNSISKRGKRKISVHQVQRELLHKFGMLRALPVMSGFYDNGFYDSGFYWKLDKSVFISGTSRFLEKPALPPQITPEVRRFKIRLAGKSGVGKTSTVAKLTGQPAPRSHCDTPGIVSSLAYWPVKLRTSAQVLMMRLQFWDTGDHIAKKYDHIHPACKEDADATLFLFSYIDRSSFLDLHKQLSDSSEDLKDRLRVIVGTKLDQSYRSEITSKELNDFQRLWKVPLISVTNVHKTETDSGRIVTETCNDLNDVAPSLNSLCEFLLAHSMIGQGLLSDYAWVRTEEKPPVAEEDNDSDEATYV